MNPIAVGQRALEGFKDEDRDSLAPHVAVGARVAELASPVGRENASSRTSDACLRREQEIHAARHSQFRLTDLQTLARQMDRHERGGAGRVDRQAGPVEVKGETDPP